MVLKLNILQNSIIRETIYISLINMVPLIVFLVKYLYIVKYLLWIRSKVSI